MNEPERLHLVCTDCHRTVRLPSTRLSEGPRCPACHTPLLRAEPVELDDNGLDAVVAASDLPVLVDFWAPWCGPCRQYGPVVADAAARWKGKVIVAKVNSDVAQRTAGRLGIRSIPTTVLFRGGREIARQAGAVPPNELSRFVATALESGAP